MHSVRKSGIAKIKVETLLVKRRVASSHTATSHLIGPAISFAFLRSLLAHFAPGKVDSRLPLLQAALVSVTAELQAETYRCNFHLILMAYLL